MKIRLFFLLLIAALMASAAVAQSVVITRKAVEYKRTKPSSDYKKTFTINYPRVKAATPALSRKIESALSYDINLKEEINDMEWLEEADYDVGYNQKGVLSVELTVEGSGAYPSTNIDHVVVDLRSGTRAKPADVFTNLTSLLSMVRRAKDAEVAKTIADLKKDPEYIGGDPQDLFKEHAKYSPLTLNDYSVDASGVTFHYDYGFPHAILAMEPGGEFHFTWAQLRSYIKPGGLLSRFVR